MSPFAGAFGMGMKPTACAAAALLSAMIATACAGRSAADGQEHAGAGGANVLLLGETHDNAEGHRERLALLRARVEAGWRPAIAMEQFDRERQADLDHAMADCDTPACVVAAAAPAKSSWNWTYYEPVIALAQQYDLPVFAANLSRVDAGKVMKSGFGAAMDAATVHDYGLDAPLPAGLLAAQVDEVRNGHCGKLPEAMLEPMARAQVARDVWMARTVAAQAGRGVVLLAGNGHVRRDVGVPYWLARHGVTGVRSIGFIESGSAWTDDDTVPFDRVRTVAAQERPDPCAAFD